MKLTKQQIDQKAKQIANSLLNDPAGINQDETVFSLVCTFGRKKAVKVMAQVRRNIKDIKQNIKPANKVALQIKKILEEDKNAQ